MDSAIEYSVRFFKEAVEKVNTSDKAIPWTDLKVGSGNAV